VKPQFGAPLTIVNYAPRVVNYAPRELLENIYSTGITHDDHYGIIMFIVHATVVTCMTERAKMSQS
jgi:hypothetical protein